MVKEPVEHRDDASGIREHLVLLFEWPVGRENHRLAFVAAIDHFIK